MIMHFRSFRLQPPHAPPSSGNASCSGRAWPPIRFVSLSAVLRTSHFSSCLISRIRPYRVCVATLHWAAVLRTIRSLPVALHPVSPRRSYFQFLAGSSAREGLSPSCARSLSSALESVALRQTGAASSGATNPRRAQPNSVTEWLSTSPPRRSSGDRHRQSGFTISKPAPSKLQNSNSNGKPRRHVGQKRSI
jgi:hypothetical protein